MLIDFVSPTKILYFSSVFDDINEINLQIVIWQLFNNFRKMTSSDKIDMDPELAKYLVDHGGTLVVTRVPSGTDFGVDLKSWTTGDNFKGIKMIPPGFHFFHYRYDETKNK